MEEILVAPAKVPYDIEIEAQKMYDHFNGNLPQGGEAMIGVLHYAQEHLADDSRDWKTIYERSNKIQRNANATRRAANVSAE
jgi:hypothetical protein